MWSISRGIGLSFQALLLQIWHLCPSSSIKNFFHVFSLASLFSIRCLRMNKCWHLLLQYFFFLEIDAEQKRQVENCFLFVLLDLAAHD
jgi:hypothetical protein